MRHLLLIITTLAFSFNSYADFESYDQIVDKLSKYTKDKREIKAQSSGNVRSYSMAHIGLGASQTFYDPSRSPLSSTSFQNQGGLIIKLGFDLFSPQWGLEGSFANYGRLNNQETDIRLREFSLKGLYKPEVANNWNMRLGIGMSSRFLDLQTPLGSASYKTPSGLFTVGIDSYINSFISVGADLNFKTAMISDSIDQNSVDLAFRIDTHF